MSTRKTRRTQVFAAVPGILTNRAATMVDNPRAMSSVINIDISVYKWLQ